jgi:hypothetical protein
MRSPEKEAVPVVEVIVTPEIKSAEESGIALETAAKSKKKSKKKSSGKSSETEAPVAAEPTIETEEVAAPPPVVEIKVAQNEQNEVKEEGKIFLLKLFKFFSSVRIYFFLIAVEISV